MATYEEELKDYNKELKQHNKELKELSKVYEPIIQETIKAFKKGQIDLEAAKKELTNITSTDLANVRALAKEFGELSKVVKQARQVYQQEATSTLGMTAPEQPVKSGWRNFVDFLSGTKQGDEDSFKRMELVRQRFGGVQQIFSGNFVSGISQVASSFTDLSRIMKGPYFIALQTIITGLIEFDKMLSRASKTAASMTGGIYSEYVGEGSRSLMFNQDIKGSLYRLGMGGRLDDLSKMMTSTYGMGTYGGRESQIVGTTAYGLTGMGSFGVGEDTTNQLMSILRLREGKSDTGILAFLSRLTQGFGSLKGSPQEAVKNILSLSEQTKGLGVNLEWAAYQVKSFEKELEAGTISLSDFAAANRSFRSGGVSQNAGIADLIADYARRSGMSLPQEFMSAGALGRGFALSTDKVLANEDIGRAYSGYLNEMMRDMNLTTTLDKAGALQRILSSQNINVSPEMIMKSITPTGEVDLVRSGVFGKRAGGESAKKEEQRAEQFRSAAESYYKGTTPWHKEVLEQLRKANDEAVTYGWNALTGGDLRDTQDLSVWGNIAQFAGFWTRWAATGVGKGLDTLGGAMNLQPYRGVQIPSSK